MLFRARLGMEKHLWQPHCQPAEKLGCSCDWQRERFTMDEGCSDAVKGVFVRLYDKA